MGAFTPAIAVGVNSLRPPARPFDVFVRLTEGRDRQGQCCHHCACGTPVRTRGRCSCPPWAPQHIAWASSQDLSPTTNCAPLRWRKRRGQDALQARRRRGCGEHPALLQPSPPAAGSSRLAGRSVPGNYCPGGLCRPCALPPPSLSGRGARKALHVDGGWRRG